MVVAAFVVALPASAWFMPSSDVVVSTNNSGTSVVNNVATVAKTGGNTIMGGGFIKTGNAYADSYVGNNVNGTDIRVNAPCSNCRGDVTVGTNNNETFVANNVTTVAKTGNNSVMSRPSRCSRSNGGMIMTGNAGSVAAVESYVNQTLVRVTR